MTSFGLDDLPWSESLLSATAIETSLDALCERLEVVAARNEGIKAHDSYFELPRFGALTLSDILYSQISPGISTTIRRRAQRWLDRVGTFGDHGIPLEVTWSGHSLLAPTVSWAHERCRSGRPTACVTVPVSARRMGVSVLSAAGEQIVHFAPDEAAHVDFFRKVVEAPGCDIAKFETTAGHAYPNLAFVPGVFRGLRDLSRPFRDRRDEICRTLSIISDNVSAIFESPKEKAIAEALHSLGLDASTETRETILDGKCRTARERVFGAKTLVFDWHVKIDPFVDRIHLHPPIAESQWRPIVGIFHSHLPLPGDL